MIRLGKLANGVALFDFEGRIRVFFQTDSAKNIIVCFDTSEYDKANPDEIWFVKDFDIYRKENNEISELLDKLYPACVARVKTFPIKYSYIDKIFETKSYLQEVGNNLEIKYPSDDYPIPDTSWFGIIKYQNQGYSLTFHKSTSKNHENIKSVCIKYKEPHISELYPVYEEFVTSLSNIATNDFEKINKEFNIYVGAKELSSKQLKLTNDR